MNSAITDPGTLPPAAGPPTRIRNYHVSGGDVRIPGWVVDFDSFRQWTVSPDFPETGRIDFIANEIWADMTMEELLTHNQVKLEIGFIIAGIIRTSNSGMVIADRMRLVHRAAGLSCEPDLAYVTWESIRAGRLQLVTNPDGQIMLLDGTPNMVMEIISNSSVLKDTVELKDQYAAASIPEYWLIDVRKTTTRFDLLHLNSGAYTPRPLEDGWQRSSVFAHDFRLIRTTNPLGKPQFNLESRVVASG